MRSLSDKFLNDLSESGILHNLLKRVQRDSTIDLQFRGNYINIYYRGGVVLTLSEKEDRYIAEINEKYFKNNQHIKFEKNIKTKANMQEWIDVLPFIKEARDFHYSEEKNTAEREFQQLIVRTNNYERTSNSSDFFITDMEYDNIGKIDLLALEWNSNNRSIHSLKTKFSFIEVKFGNGAVKGESGLNKHLEDIHNFVSKNDEYLMLIKDTVLVFEQKRMLNLYNLGTNNNSIALDHIESTQPYFIVLLADYKNNGKNLLELIIGVDTDKYNSLDIRFSIASFMGYGLYSDCLLTKDEAIKYLNRK